MKNLWTGKFTGPSGEHGIANAVVFMMLVIITGAFLTVAEDARGEPVADGSGYVIRLASISTRDFSEQDIRGVDVPSGQGFYATRFNKGGRTWRQLRLGVFSTRAEAVAVLRSVERKYPGAQITRVSSVDRRFATSGSIGRPAAVASSAETAARVAPGVTAEKTGKSSSFMDGLKKLSPVSWFGRKKDEEKPDAKTDAPATKQPGMARESENTPAQVANSNIQPVSVTARATPARVINACSCKD